MPTNLLIGEVKQIAKDKPINLLPELTGVYKDSDGSTKLPKISRREPLIQDLYNSFQSGLGRLWATTARIPAGVYDIAAMPQNFLMKTLGKKELQVKSPEWLMDNPIAEFYDYQTEVYEKAITPTKSFAEALATKDFDGVGRHLAIQVVKNAPQQIGIILSFMAGYPNVGIAGMGMLETTQSLKEARKQKKDPAMNAYNSLTKGIIEAGFESIGTMGILKRWSKSLTASFGAKNAKLITADIFKTVFHSMLGEGNEEFWTSLAQDFSDYTTGINPDAMKDSLPRAFEAGTVGAISGGLLTGPGAIRIGHASASFNKMKADVEQVRRTIEEEAPIPPEKPPVAPVEAVVPEVEVEVEKPAEVLPEAIIVELPLAEIKTAIESRNRAKLEKFIDKNLQREIERMEKREVKRLSLREKAELEIKNIEAVIQAVKESPEYSVYGEKIFEAKGETLKDLRAQIALQRERLKRLKPEVIKIKETILLERRIADIARGVREGRITTKREIASVQKQLVDIINQAGLEAKDRAKFLATIKNIQTRAQLEKALPAIEERIIRLAEISQKQAIVKEIIHVARPKVDPDYREEIDGILEGFDLKARTEATRNRRQKKQAFIERQREEGNLDFLPPDFFTDFGKTTLDEMTLEEVEQLRDQIQVLATVGATKNRLIAVRGERDFQRRLGSILDRAYERAGTKEQLEGEAGPVISNQRKGTFERAREIIDNFFAAHRKIEFTLRTLDNQEVFEIIQDGINNELRATEEAYVKIKDAFALISKNLNTMSSDLVAIKGVPVELTREQMIGVVLNNGNRGNRQRLMDGNKFTLEQIRAIEKALKPSERKFIDAIFGIIDEQFPKTVEVAKKLVGIKPKKVEGDYFPIVTDYELNKQAKFNAAKRDLFQDIFHITFVERGFTKARVGGRAPINLNVFSVIFKHIDSVIHFNSMAIPVRDMQKILNHPRFAKAVTDIMGEPVYNQFSPWLRDIANPSNLTASNSMDKIFQFLRHNATAAILGHRLTVSLLQGGSITQTINEIGVKDTINGVKQFYKNPQQAIEFVYSVSPIMKNRAQTFDREIKDYLRSGQAQRITQGKKSWGEILFSMIRGVDFVTTMPTWLGAYEKNLAQTQDVEESARYADGVVRRTQPAGAMENLSSIMRGSATQKLFTSFMTHFSNMHNQMVEALDTLKYSKDHSMRKSANFARAMWWLWIAPSLLAGWIRSGFKLEDWRKFAQELILYPFAGMFLIRDIMNAIIKGFDFGAPPGLAAFREMQLAFQSKKGQKKLKHGVKAVGLFTGKIPTQWVDTVDGFIDILNEETQDFKRLIWGEKAISPVERGIFAPRRRGKGVPRI